jgi:hypothetical protein
MAPLVTGLLTNYTNYLSTPVIQTSDRQNAARALSAVFDTLISAPSADIMTLVWNYFIAHQNDLLMEGVALQGIQVLSAAEQFEFIFVYSLFRQAAFGTVPVSLTAMAAQVVKCPTLVAFLQAQAALILPTGTTRDSALVSGSGIAVTTDNTTTTIGLAPIAANTILANTGGSAAIPVGIPIAQLLGNLTNGISIVSATISNQGQLSFGMSNGSTIVASGIISGVAPEWNAGTVAAVGNNISLSSGTVSLTGVELSVNKNAANGYAGLDSTGHIALSLMPSSITGGMSFEGTWNAAINTPALTSGVGTKGFFYQVSTAGSTVIDGTSTWLPADLITFDGAAWIRIIGNPNQVLSINGQTGQTTITATTLPGLGVLATASVGSNLSINNGTVSAIVPSQQWNVGSVTTLSGVTLNNGTLAIPAAPLQSIAGLTGTPTAVQLLTALLTPGTIVATGTDQATAATLSAYTTVVTSAPPGTGIVLQAIPEQIIFNRDPVNTVLLYPLGTAQIEANGASQPVVIASMGGARLAMTSPTQYYAGIA